MSNKSPSKGAAIRPSLEGKAQNWQTPKVATRGYSYPNGDHNKPFMNLEGQAKTGTTPTARDFKDGANPSENVPTNGVLGRQAPRWNQTTGPPKCLNPRFVEALMGFPRDWTDCERWETPSCQRKRNSPSKS